jgi:hypothetical protein
MFWKIKVPQKVKICAWKMLVGGLPTRETKKHKHMEVDNMCQRCGCVDEDGFHAVVVCPRAAALWDAMKEVWDIPEKEQLMHTGPEWLFDLLDDDARARVLMIIWRNWHNRSEIIHGKKEAPLEASRSFLQSYMNSLLLIDANDGKDILKGKSVISKTMKKKGRTH